MPIINLAIMFFILFSVACDEVPSKSKGFKPDSYKAELNKNLAFIANLNDSVKETSGLIFFEGSLITHNDRGGLNQLYVLDTSNGNITNTIILSDAVNVDYEDIAQSRTHIFIGDFGNNKGDRTDLKILKIKKTDINLKKDTCHVISEKIHFAYSDQKQFEKSKAHNYDCEAMIYFNDSLYLFTKNRLDKKCNLYVLPDKPGAYKAQLISNFDTQALVSGAAISEDGNKIVLSAYEKNGNTSLWILSNYLGNDFFSGKKQHIILGPFIMTGQVEGVCFSNSKKLFLSAEKTNSLSAKLYSFNF